MPLHGPGQGYRLDVSPDGGELFRRVRVVDASDLLLDDRALVQVRRYVVRGRPDQLDATRVGLVVRLRAAEARQEGVVDVDDPAAQVIAQLAGQHLHVPREHHQVDPVLGDQAEQLRLLLRPGLGGHRQIVERHSVGRGQRLDVRMVRDDGRDVDVQRADLPAIQKVVEAVADFRHEQQRAAVDRRVVQLPLHREPLGDVRETVTQVGRTRRTVGRDEVDPHEELACAVVAELLAVDDVALSLGEEARYRVHDADLVAAHESLLHKGVWACLRGSVAGAREDSVVGFNFIAGDRDQVFLLPPDMRDWLPAGHLAWFVIDVVDQVDLSRFHAAYRADGHGHAAYDPAVLVAILLYAYCCGIRS